MPGERFTSWLSGDERAGLRKLAVYLECSENYIVRIAVRALLFNKPIPPYLRHAAEEVTRVTQITEKVKT